MHIPHHFKNENLQEVRDFLVKNSFGILINTINGKLWGSHIPLELDQDATGNDVLYGHISKANPQWKSFQEEKDVLAIFSGTHSYISASWYNHENVSTWNYIAVHVYGRIQPIGEEELLASLKKLTDKYEENMENPMRVEDLSPKTLRMIRGVVGFKIIISDIQAAYKLSQNRHDEDYHHIVKKLEETKDPASIGIAENMKKKRKK